MTVDKNVGIDLLTKAPFIKRRSNHLHVTTTNKTTYWNRINAEKEKHLRKINKVLKDSWQVLYNTLGDEEKVIVSRDYLAGAGYDPTYYTGIDMEKDVLHIYEFRVRTINENEFVIYKELRNGWSGSDQ